MTVVEFGRHALQLLEATRRLLILVRDQLAVEVDGEHDEDDDGGHDERGRDDRCFPVDVDEAHPGEDRHLDKEEEDADAGRQDPRHLDVAVHAFVRRLLDGHDAVHVADRLDVRQDARADHEGEQVDGDDERRTDAERDQPASGDRLDARPVQVHLNHRHLQPYSSAIIIRSRNLHLIKMDVSHEFIKIIAVYLHAVLYGTVTFLWSMVFHKFISADNCISSTWKDDQRQWQIN